MRIACYLEPSRLRAAGWMRAFAAGCGGHVVKNGKRDQEATDHVVMGNWPVAVNLIAEFKADRTPFWFLDSAYIQDTTEVRYLRVERSQFWPRPTLPQSADRATAMGIAMKPWKRAGTHVLICLQAMKFGRPWGIDIVEWNDTIEARIRAATDRRIVMRSKPGSPAAKRAAPPLEKQLSEAWCVVTHSSTVAVKAVLAGVPVFCEPTCAAAPVGCTDFSQIEYPRRPDRRQWIADLAWRQWSRLEMRSGLPWAHLQAEQ